MTEDKYYTPTLEELHIGYNYELYDSIMGADVWTFLILNTRMLHAIETNHHRIRTKYLDKEDIKSLGWEEVSPNKYRTVMKNPKDFDYEYYTNPVYLYLEFSDYLRPHRLRIHNNEQYEEYNQWFEGECKSINELKKLMQWLKI